ncbi:aspartate aminotransferase family protein [Arthrobacter sp. KFRI-F3372]|uniref:4-aminobutyrate aminotransferase-like enzyme n=1 Tax=Pseudarthrobacter oxydans TaxID=1671 RepID=A0AAW8NCM4_PSEOX|nr:aspartate aminotransferase family protein [Pseudarthrobacter oxydans]MDR6793634.1 4-aminobutyrate aminotransferase-like enzyme [Pseudarthrobacter oxydans]MDR7165042.1 4-aminobutyrate aminotransferase-like enzyme [Pseudarthrobacter oxydans]MDV2980292.1 aspartate aminotransferase family protein [Actinomycetes bacterium ARC8]WHP58776.1 aspartate aminotransferase family protein [Arthrobacter sp. KFRI-F3372]
MVIRSTIMDTNSFRAEHAAGLDPDTRRLTERRDTVLGASYRLFYRNPVHLVRGEGQYLWDASGRKYLDAYNNVASLGHCHPAVTAAVTAQMQQLNTHTRYLHENILNYTDDLLSTMPAELNKAMYMCTGSEANDLAIRVAKAYSGGEGIIATTEAYHGTSELTSGISPALGTGQPLAPTARLVEAPDAYRLGSTAGADGSELGTWFANRIRAAIADMEAHGIRFAGFIADSIFSSDGVLPGPAGYLREAAEVIHRAGGIIIADEVQPGFGRTGDAFWGFQRHGIVPDVVTLGKPMGNGIPVSGLVAKADVLAAFSDTIPYFNTFGGNPVSMAAAQAVLSTIRAEGLQEHSRVVGGSLLDALRGLGDTHESVGDVRGAGLFIGFELVKDRTTREPHRELALAVLEQLRERGVLTSVAGPHGNVLKLRPPLAFQPGDIDWLVGALDDSLTALYA